MSNFVRAMSAKFPEDLPKIRAVHPLLSRLSDIEVEKLWEEFSDDACASWLIPDSHWLTSFKGWIES